MSDSSPWFERWPELAAWELERFRARGLPAEIDDAAKARGQFVVRTTVPFRGGEVPVEVAYPAETPELPPTVFGPPGLLDRHQHAFGGNFCLLERPFDDWPAGSWGAADLIAERLVALLADTESGPQAVQAGEAPMPEPFTAYYDYALGPVVLMPGNLVSPPGDRGAVRLRLFDEGSFRFLVEGVDGTVGHAAVLGALPLGRTVQGRWKRIDAPPPAGDADELVSWLRRNHPGLLQPTVPKKLAGSRYVKAPDVQVVGLLFQEEGPGVGEFRDAWLFAAMLRTGESILVHHQVVSPEERARRIPELSGLAGKRAVLVGLGTLGGEIAVHLGRAGVGGLDLVDHDRFDAGNTVRHVLSVDYSGLAKTAGVGIAVRRANPFCDVRGHDIYLGQTRWEGEGSFDRLSRVIESADVVMESTGSHQIQRLAARVAAEHNVPFVSAWLTNGFWGAEVLRIVPGKTSCFVCFARAHAEGELARAIAGPDEMVVAQGCSHPTVPGAGFDASEATAVASRLAVQTVLANAPYPDADWDHVAMNFRSDLSNDSATRFITERLVPNPDCPLCQSAGSSARL